MGHMSHWVTSYYHRFSHTTVYDIPERNLDFDVMEASRQGLVSAQSEYDANAKNPDPKEVGELEKREKGRLE